MPFLRSLLRREGYILRNYCSSVTKSPDIMAERAFKRGDPLPRVSRDVMRFYNMRFCPYAQRTRIVLLHKNIPHEMVNCNLRYKPEWLLERNPLGLVPVLEYRGEVVYESRICDEYLDNLFPHHGNGRLQSNSPGIQARDSMLMHHFDTKIAPSLYGVLNPKNAEKARETMTKGLQILEHGLIDKQYFGGKKPCMVDYHMFPWFERFPALQQLSKMATDEEYNPLPSDLYPRLSDWLSRIQELPAVKQTMLPTEYHMEFMTKLKMRQPEYDIGLPAVAAKL